VTAARIGATGATDDEKQERGALAPFSPSLCAPSFTAMRLALLALALGCALTLSAAVSEPRMPYAQAGLDAEAAAAHLLARFTFGARPGEAARVAEEGLERWLDRQLDARLRETTLDARLNAMPAMRLSADEIARTYPPAGRVLTEALAAGVVARPDSGALRDLYRSGDFQRFMDQRGYRPERELGQQLGAQKLLRARYAENQLQEVLTDFWFNHFNVAAQDGPARPHLLAYERDAIRPRVLGDFRALLGATAKHPAMLLYLDNAQSVAPEGTATTMQRRVAGYENARGLRGAVARRRIQQGRAQMRRDSAALVAQIPDSLRDRLMEARRRRGVNENYARELLELHTLGVDGGYTQADVENVARAFTGWTVWPSALRRGDNQLEGIERRMERAQGAGFVRDGLFLFRADAHDATAKTILGQRFPEGGGIEEGERVLDLVAAHPGTARHLARKLAVRFVSDAPPEALVAHLADVFTRSRGDLKAVVRAIAYHPEFWSAAAIGGKVKSPFELAMSALRATGAEIEAPGTPRGNLALGSLAAWIERMGQPLYRYQAPTGFPDRAEAWLSAGTLAARLGFGLKLATGAVPGVTVPVQQLYGGTLPRDAEAAVTQIAATLLPAYRTEDLATLTALARDSDAYAARLADQAPDASADAPMMDTMDDAPARNGRGAAARLDRVPPRDTSPAAQALGVLLGSPAFQRR
jgi:uncharacterized protein (DUF1800 family)